MSDLHLDGIRMRSSNPTVKLDFGAFGKGYGIDLAVEHLKEMGIQNTILNAGGDLRAIGSRNGEPWRIAIRDPSGEGVLGVIETHGSESIFTSGDYERNFTWEGKRYHHIIDPRTGYPAVGTRSVTVIHDDATTADAAATALFIAGPSRWQEIARRMGVGYVLLVDTEGTLHMNPAMQARVALTDSSHTIKLSPRSRQNPNVEQPGKYEAFRDYYLDRPTGPHAVRGGHPACHSHSGYQLHPGDAEKAPHTGSHPGDHGGAESEN